MKLTIVLCIILWGSIAFAQDNYEIQVYASPTQERNSSIFELHSNYTFDGNKKTENGVFPSYHALHETVEITTGIADNFELGVYLFMNSTPGHGFQFVGTHIRPRITAPDRWKLPVGLSLSAEFGYQKSAFSEDTWNIEIRPIIDKQWPKLYAAFNPAMGISLKGVSNKHTPVFEPNIKISYLFFKNTSLGIEYYGSIGYINNFESLPDQEHAVYAAYDLMNNDKWELNMGVGFGLTQATDKLIGKVLIGRKINWKAKK